jgi:hypothetical protein
LLPSRGSAGADDVGQTIWLHLVDHLANIREPTALPGWPRLVTGLLGACLEAG